MPKPLPTRQAVIVIHGIGEERPTDTLRSFVETVVSVTNKKKQRYWSKPDEMAETFELRKFIAPGDDINWPMTDYYEYYWASNMRDTELAQVLTWLKRLMLVPYRDMPRRIRWIWITTWTLIWLAILFGIGSLLGYVGLPGLPALPGWTMSLLSVLGAAVVNKVFIDYIGDAARYLSPEPCNIAQRQAIRKGGVDLLQKLHSCGKYGRIIVVGHSLGSVIAYDILRIAWDSHRQDKLHAETKERVGAMERFRAVAKKKPSEDEPRPYWDEYQKAQKGLWRAERMRGGSWLVTDLVTCGSPLAHAQVLMAKNLNDLLHWQYLRELPTCPPVEQGDEDSLTYDIPLLDNDGREIGRADVLHTSALFALTRWTNLYFKNDFIGGPLHGVFGHGIRDIRIAEDVKGAAKWLPHRGFWRGRTWLSHNMYWEDPNGGRSNDTGSLFRRWDAVRRMRGAMDIANMRLVTFPSPPGGATGQRGLAIPGFLTWEHIRNRTTQVREHAMISREEATAGNDRAITMTRVFDAQPHELFRAWTDPEMISEWFAPEPMTVPRAEIDLRPGGRMTLVMRDPEGNEFTSVGEYLEIVDPQRIVYTDSLDEMPASWVDMVNAARGEEPGARVPDGIATITFQPVDEYHTRLTFSEMWDSKATRDAFVEMQMIEGLDMAFDNLAKLLAREHANA